MQPQEQQRSIDMHERICLVTGATSGIGLATARELAARRATLVLVGRNETKTRALVQALRQRTNTQIGAPAVEYLLADLSSQAEVRGLAKAFQRRYGALHVLVNNAGLISLRRQQTVDGLELTLAVNHLAPFLLTTLLLDTLRASAPARVVTVASAAHRGAQMPFDDLQQTQGRYSGLRAYGQSKLANIMFTYALARRLTGSNVTANTLHPGFVASGFARNNGVGMNLAMTIVRPFAISPEQGAQTTLYLASSPQAETVSGQYFVKCQRARSSPESYDKAGQERLWEVSEQLTGRA
jgi:NAD(P)-dependent dehydrogenase (short-subunit alcohol dehydrogenase family)